MLPFVFEGTAPYAEFQKAFVHNKRNGKLTPATVVDHIIPHRGNEHLMWSESNWQSLCKRCHDKKTGRFDSTPKYEY